MKRYLVTGFLLLVPLFGMSMATRELVNGMSKEKSVMENSSTTLVAVNNNEAPHQLIRVKD